MKTIKAWAFALVALSASTLPTAQAAVWDDTETWSVAWEGKYANWMANEFQLDTFALKVRDTLAIPVFEIDLPYFTRALFASKNGLPFVVRSRANSRKLITNRSTAWDTVPAGDARVFTFLSDIHSSLTYDRLSLDSFPLAVSKDAIQPGAYYLINHSFDVDAETGVKVIKSLDAESAFMTYLLPQEGTGRTLFERAFHVVSQPSGASGFMAMRWPNEKLDGFENHKAIKDPRFDERAQYQDSLTPLPGLSRDAYIYRVQQAITGADWSDEQEMKQDVMDLCLHVRSRVDWVNQAIEFLSMQRTVDPAYSFKPGTPEYNRFSTPVRDKAILNHHRAIQDKYRVVLKDNLIQAQYAACSIQYGWAPQQSMSLLEYRIRMLSKKVGSDPNGTLEQRWGVQ